MKTGRAHTLTDNMKRLMAAAWVLLGMVLLGSCDDEVIEVDEVNKQTIFVYMPWSGSANDEGLYSCFLANLDSIEAAIKKKGGLDKSRLVVFLSESGLSSKLYEVVYDKHQGLSHKMLKEYSGHDYTTTEGLTRIFNDVQGVAYALNYALIAGGHGTGWTGVNDWQDYPNRMPRRASKVFPAKAASINDLPYPRTRFYGSVTSKDYSIDITQLSEAIRQAGMHMQYILFDDCYMANVEVAYELRDVTNFLLASTSEVFDEGMPYAKMWSYLATPTPNYSSAISAFKSYLDNYEAPEGSSPFSVAPTGTLAAIDCRQMDNLAAVMRQVNEHYTLDEALLLDLQVLDGFDDPLFYDMGHYVETLCTDPYLLEKFEAQLTKTVVSKTATSRLYSHIYRIPKFIEVNTFSGLTISDPSYNAVIQESKKQTAWWKATHP